MQKRHVNILLGILGAFVIVCVLLIAGGVWFALSVLHREPADATRADAAFRAARGRFVGTAPVFALRPGGPALMRPVPAAAPAAPLRTLHVLAWDPDEASLTQADVPFALLRRRDAPMDVMPYVNTLSRERRIERGVSIRVSELERYGPSLLIDEELEDDHRVLVWTD